MVYKNSTTFARKKRRIAKYGKYKRSSGAIKRYTYAPGRAGMKRSYAPLYTNPFSRNTEKIILKYSTNVQMDPKPTVLGVGGTNSYVFQLNNLFDPDTTGVGHQPMYFDNMATLWSKYKVDFAKIKVTVVNSTANTAVYNAGVVTQPTQNYKLLLIKDLQAGTDIPSTINELIEQRSSNIKWRFVSPQFNGSLPSISMHSAPHKDTNRSYKDDTLLSLTTAGPSQGIYCGIYITSADGVTDPPVCYLDVQITYYATFYDRLTNQPAN